jgi:hypothetical protein
MAALPTGQAGQAVAWRLAKGLARKKMLLRWAPMACRCANGGGGDGAVVVVAAVIAGKDQAHLAALKAAVKAAAPHQLLAAVPTAQRNARAFSTGARPIVGVAYNVAHPFD